MNFDKEGAKVISLIQAAIDGEKLEYNGVPVIGARIYMRTGEGKKFDCDRWEPFTKVEIVKTPKYLPWGSIEEMGEAVKHWFREKEDICVNEQIIKVNHDFFRDKKRLAKLFDCFEHSSDLKTWLPCGVEVKP